MSNTDQNLEDLATGGMALEEYMDKGGTSLSGLKEAEIVERLQSVSEEDAYARPWTFGQTCQEAAALIEQQRDEIARLEKALRLKTMDNNLTGTNSREF